MCIVHFLECVIFCFVGWFSFFRYKHLNLKRGDVLLKSFSELQKQMAQSKSKTLVVAAAHDYHTLEAVFQAKKVLPMNYILVGNKEKILQISKELSHPIDEKNILEAETNEAAAKEAVRLIKSGVGDVLMKGILETGTLLKAVLDKETGIRGSGTMSHCAILEIPAYNKLIGVTDGGMIPYPSLEQKADIVKNAVTFFHNLGVACPNVAVLAAAENVSDKMPETKDALFLKEQFTKEDFGCVVEGPISFDLAVSKESAEIKGYKSMISGETDIMLVPNMVTGNVFCKSLLYWANAKMAGCVLGATAPIVLVSRGATAEEKFLSIMLCLGSASK